MSCGANLNYKNIIFKIVKINRLKENHTYIFAGNVKKEIQKILEKYESKKNLLKKEKDDLEKYYGKKNLGNLFSIKTKKFSIIYESIFIDDSITNIRRKIFAFLSKSNDLILEQNQELWVKMKKGDTKILGFKYENLEFLPSLYQKEIKPDHKSFISKNGQIILTEPLVNNNDMTIFDSTNGLEFENNEIYLHNLLDEVAYLNKNKKLIDDFIKNGYFVKHWPLGTNEFSNSQYVESLSRMKKLLKSENKLVNFIDNVEYDKKSFGDCSIIQVLVHIKNDSEEDFIDLRKIFQFLALDEKTPFIRYKDADWPTPWYLFYKPLIENRVITERQMREWIINTKYNRDTKMKEIKYSIRGLTIKRHIYDLDGEPKYATINIHKNGNIEIRLAYKEVYHATMKNVYDALIDIGSLIKKINDIDYRAQRKISRKLKINQPDVTFDANKNLINFGKYTNLILMDTINGINIDGKIDYKKMNDFANNFTPFVSPVLSQKNSTNRMLILKYKRVSNYSKMNEVYEFIHKTLQQTPNAAVETIVNLVADNFKKSIDEAIKSYKDWERKYGFLGIHSKRGVRQIGVEIKVLNNKLYLKGSKTIMQLTDTYNFICKFLKIYFNQSYYLSKTELKSLISDDILQIENIENESLLNNVNNQNNTYMNTYNYNNTLGDIYGENYSNYIVTDNVNNANDDVAVEDSNIANNANNPFPLDRENYLAKDSEIAKDIGMKCKDQVKEKDTCDDFCEDEFYALRRLQKYDNAIFRFRSDPKFKNYARKCQPQERQPLVLHYDPLKDSRIDSKSFKNVVKYGSSPDRQNYYLCAQVWCPIEEIPISMESIKNDIVERPMRKGKCLTAKCPSCLKNKKVTWLKIIPKDKFHPYIGFLDPSIHPLGNLCLPCCFKKPMEDKKSKKYNIYKKCVGEDVNSNQEDEQTDYIMGRDKMPLYKNRFGILPANLAKLFSSRCDTGYMQDKQSCFLRRGVVNDEKQSFLQVIVSIVESDDNPITKKVLKEYLFNKKLENERLFSSLNNGELKILFDDKKSNLTPIENFKKYMMDNTEKITEEFLIDFLSRPNVLFKEGLNIFLLDSRSLLCPSGFNAREFYKKNRKSIFIYTDGRYYEPLYKVTNKKGELIHEKLFLFSNPIVEKIYNMILNNCESKQIINWEKIRKENLKDKYYNIHENLNASNMLSLLNKNKIEILGQIKDKYNKSIGFMTKYNFPVFFLPEGENININVVEKWKPQSFKDTYNFYNKISQQTKIPHQPIRLYRDNNNLIIAILLENNSIIPVKPTNANPNLLEGPGKFYYDVDNYLYSEEKIVDRRTKLVQYIVYLNESYERVRFEISRNIQNNKIKEEIYEIIRSDKNLNERRNRLRLKLKSLLTKLCIVVKTLPFNIDNYVKPSIRTVCESYQKYGNPTKVKTSCNKSFHCHFTNGKCKLIILEKNPINYTNNFDIFLDRVTEEILRNKFLRDEIMEDKIEDIIDKNNFNFRPNQIALTGATDILDQIKKLYEKKETYYINPADMYSTVEPKYYGINKNKYLIAHQELTIDSLNLNFLPSHWIKIFKKKYKYYDEKAENNSMYLSLIRILSDTETPIKNNM